MRYIVPTAPVSWAIALGTLIASALGFGNESFGNHPFGS